MKCNVCNNEIPAGVVNCPSCGSKLQAENQPQIVMSEKKRLTYALLGFFLGNFGVHDYYAGRPGRALGNIVGNILVSPFLVQVSTGIELLTTTKDGDGKLLQGNSVGPIILGISLIILNLILGAIAVFILLGALALTA